MLLIRREQVDLLVRTFAGNATGGGGENTSIAAPVAADPAGTAATPQHRSGQHARNDRRRGLTLRAEQLQALHQVGHEPGQNITGASPRERPVPEAKDVGANSTVNTGKVSRAPAALSLRAPQVAALTAVPTTALAAGADIAPVVVVAPPEANLVAAEQPRNARANPFSTSRVTMGCAAPTIAPDDPGAALSEGCSTEATQAPASPNGRRRQNAGSIPKRPRRRATT